MISSFRFVIRNLKNQIKSIIDTTLISIIQNPLGSIGFICILLLFVWFFVWSSQNGLLSFDSITLWDWLDLLLIPLSLALAGFIFTRSERLRKNNSDNQKLQDSLLISYLDKMKELVIDRNLSQCNSTDSISLYARAITFTTLTQMSGINKGLMLRFLAETGIINGESPPVNMQGADLDKLDFYSFDIHEKWPYLENTYVIKGISFNKINLAKANLAYSSFDHISITDSDLSFSFLLGVDFTDASIENCKMYYAKLQEANLTNVNISGSDLRGAMLISANLRGAVIVNSRLEGATFGANYFTGSRARDAILDKIDLSGTTFDDTTIWPNNFDPVQKGAINISNNN